MEENNGRTEQTLEQANSISFDELMNEYNKLRGAYEQLLEKAKELNNMWLINRANFLFNITQNEAFPEDTRQRAVKELSDFMFPINEKEQSSDEQANKEE